VRESVAGPERQRAAHEDTAAFPCGRIPVRIGYGRCHGRKKGESALACAHRELAEELGVTGAMREVDVVELFHDYHDDTVTVFVVTRISGAPKVDKIEIADAQWFDISDLPKNLTTLTRHVLERTA
jgi:ADP-ribose pyrophosphatase YjhB (NUDIX family)